MSRITYIKKDAEDPSTKAQNAHRVVRKVVPPSASSSTRGTEREFVRSETSVVVPPLLAMQQLNKPYGRDTLVNLLAEVRLQSFC